MYIVEALLTKETYTAENWRSIASVLAGHAKGFNTYSISVLFQENIVKIYVSSKKDLSTLSNGLEGLSFRPAQSEVEEKLQLPHGASKIGFLKIPNGGNVLDLRERYKVQEGKTLELLRLDVQRLGKRLSARMSVMMSLGNAKYCSTRQLALFPAHLLAMDFLANTKYIRSTVPIYVSLEKNLHLMQSQNNDALFKVDAFPYASHDYYLHLNSYEFDKHSFIIGASGSGKSKFISLFVDRLSRMGMRMNYRVIVIDPHASLADDFGHIPESKVISFGKNDSTDLFPGAGTDLTSATELTATLFKSVLADQFSPRLDRLLRFTLFTLMTAQAMSLENLKRFLTDIEYRNQILEHVHGYIPANVMKFFGGDFNELRTQYYNETILPLVSMVDEMQLQPSLVGESEVSLAKTIQENFLTVFSLNKVSMGDKVVKTVAGLLIQQIFLLAQARAFGQKVILIIDEVSVVQNPALAQILAEARKFNLTVILTQQYFGQIEADLQAAIFANVYNYYAFKVSEEDARALEGNLNIELPKVIVEAEHAKGVKESDVKIKIMTELHPRECLVRVLANGQVAPAIKARTMDAPVITESNKSVNLRSVEQVLPLKFVEGNALTKPSIDFSPVLQTRIDEVEQKPDTSEATNLVQSVNRFSGVRDLLSMHSSSRAKVNKRDK